MSASGKHGQKRTKSTAEANELRLQREASRIAEYKQWCQTINEMVLSNNHRGKMVFTQTMH